MNEWVFYFSVGCYSFYSFVNEMCVFFLYKVVRMWSCLQRTGLKACLRQQLGFLSRHSCYLASTLETHGLAISNHVSSNFFFVSCASLRWFFFRFKVRSFSKFSNIKCVNRRWYDSPLDTQSTPRILSSTWHRCT